MALMSDCLIPGRLPDRRLGRAGRRPHGAHQDTGADRRTGAGRPFRPIGIVTRDLQGQIGFVRSVRAQLLGIHRIGHERGLGMGRCALRADRRQNLFAGLLAGCSVLMIVTIPIA